METKVVEAFHSDIHFLTDMGEKSVFMIRLNKF